MARGICNKCHNKGVIITNDKSNGIIVTICMCKQRRLNVTIKPRKPRKKGN